MHLLYWMPTVVVTELLWTRTSIQWKISSCSKSINTLFGCCSMYCCSAFMISFESLIWPKYWMLFNSLNRDLSNKLHCCLYIREEDEVNTVDYRCWKSSWYHCLLLRLRRLRDKWSKTDFHRILCCCVPRSIPTWTSRLMMAFHE